MQYSPTIAAILFGAWGIGSFVVAWFVRRRFYAFACSVALVAPAIAYSMLRYGLLEMGGVFHGLIAGLWVLPFHFIFQRIRAGNAVQPPARG